MTASTPPSLPPAPGDHVICTKACTIPALLEHFELSPVEGDAFQVVAIGLPVLPAFGEETMGLGLLGVLDPDGEKPRFGLPANFFSACTEATAQPGWRRFRMRLDRHRLSRFYKLTNAGVNFEDLPPILKKWWMKRY